MFWIHWIINPAVGILLYIFLSLLFWDLYRFLPSPLGNCYEEGGEKAAKAEMKKWMFLIGCVFVLCMLMVWDQFWGISLLSKYNSDSVLTWTMLLGFSTPLVALFLTRVLLTLTFGIFVLYQSAESLYDGSKVLIVKHLRKNGRIE